MRYLGIDYGAKRVGIALSDEEGRVAFPHEVFSNDKNLIAALAALCRERGIAEIVVGESRTLSGAPNKITEKIDLFNQELAQTTNLPIQSEPEFWTSAQAERFQGKIKKLDASAAAIILQSFLDRQNNL